jgi:hypothetical protein
VGRNNSDFLTGTYKINDGGMTSYFTGKGENAVGTGSGAVVQVHHPQDIYDNNPSAYDVYSNRADDYDMKRWAEENADKRGNVPLFNATHKPPVIHFAMATKDAGYEAGSLGLHAVADTERRFGERPWASDNTSSFSTPVTNEAIERGIIPGVIGKKPGELAEQGNSYGFGDAHGQIQVAHKNFKRAKSRAENRDSYNWDGGEGFEEVDPSVVGQDARTLTKEGIKYKKETDRVNAAKEALRALPQGAPLKDIVTAVKNTRRRVLPGGKSVRQSSSRLGALKSGLSDGKSGLTQQALPGL